MQILLLKWVDLVFLAEPFSLFHAEKSVFGLNIRFPLNIYGPKTTRTQPLSPAAEAVNKFETLDFEERQQK